LYDPSIQPEQKAPLTLREFIDAIGRDENTFRKYGYSDKMSPNEKVKWASNLLRDLEREGYVFRINIVDSDESLYVLQNL
jgi:hypothetical protein